MSKPYLTHTPLESRKVKPLHVKKYTGEERGVEDLVQQYLIFMKYDGICGVMFVHTDGTYHFKSRTGEDITCFDHVGRAHAAMPLYEMACLLQPDEDRPKQYSAGVYFGEFWHPDYNATTIGGWNNLVDPDKLEATKAQRESVSFVVFDFLTWDEWNVGMSYVGFAKRIGRIDWMQCIGLPGDPGAPPNVKYPPLFVAPCEGTPAENKDFVSMAEMAEFAKTAGRYDGIIAVDPLGQWEKDGRDLAKIKFKPTLTVDVQVVGYELGKGKYSASIGKVIYMYKGKLGKCSGMTDALRGVDEDSIDELDEFFNRNWQDRVIEVEAMEESKHGLLREPRFKRFRVGVDASKPE